MKKIWLVLTLVAALFSSCGSDDNEEPQIKPEYKIILSNDMYSFKYNLNYNRWLYDICLVASNGEVYQLGDLQFGDAEVYELPETHHVYDVMFIATKVGANREEAMNNYYIVPGVKGTPTLLAVIDGKKTVYSFTEDATWDLMKFKTVEQLRQFAIENAVIFDD